MVITLGYVMKVDCHACIGGTNVHDDLCKLNYGSHIVVGTPGRICDMITRKYLSTQFIKTFVLDEADKMWSRGFKDHIEEVFKIFKENIQFIFLFATMCEDFMNVSTQFMRNPVRILMQNEEPVLKGLYNIILKYFFMYHK